MAKDQALRKAAGLGEIDPRSSAFIRPRTRDRSTPFSALAGRIMPQIVPANMLDHCQRAGQDLITMPFCGGLSVTFVVDEAERYYFVSGELAAAWEQEPMDMLKVALDNLRGISCRSSWKQIGTGARAMFLYETFDGYDASRALLLRDLVDIAGQAAGNLLVGVPHRDFLVALGDADPDFVAEMKDLVTEYFDTGSYPISPDLFILQNGILLPHSAACETRMSIN